MNYHKVYGNIVQKAIDEDRKWRKGTYYERHHILPKSLGGTDKQTNIVLLTAREHYICHLLLVKMYEAYEESHIKMLRALNMMKVKHDKHERDFKFSSKLYESMKARLYGENGLLVGENNPNYGVKQSKETRKKKSDAAKRRCADPKERERLRQMALNRTPEHAEKIRQGNLGLKRSDETKKKLRKSLNEWYSKGNKPANSKKVMADGVVYDTLHDAGNELDLTPSGVLYRIRSSSKKFKDYYYLD
jgi:hypothetical protein